MHLSNRELACNTKTAEDRRDVALQRLLNRQHLLQTKFDRHELDVICIDYLEIESKAVGET